MATISLGLGMGACASDISTEGAEGELVARPRPCAIASVAAELSEDGDGAIVSRCSCPPLQHYDPAQGCVCDWSNDPPDPSFGCAVPGPFVPPSMA